MELLVFLCECFHDKSPAPPGQAANPAARAFVFPAAAELANPVPFRHAFPAVRNFFRILFETAWGPVAACAAAAAFTLLVCVAADTLCDLFGAWPANILSVLALLLLLAAAVAALAAFVRALVRRRWRRALVQSLLELGILAAFAAALLPAMFLGFDIAYRLLPGHRSWHAVPGTPFPFAVEYRRAHPFLVEYDKLIAFPSGKRFGLWPDTGGNADFAAYALPDGTFALADGFRFPPPSVYRIDPAAETVETRGDGVWFSLLPGCKAITWRGGSGIGVQTRFGERSLEPGRSDDGAFESRRYLGLVTPRAFDPSAPDPLASPPAP